MTGLACRARGGRWLAAISVTLALAGCFYQQPRIDAANETAKAAYEGCEQARKAGKYRTHRAAVECAVPTVIGAYQEAGYPYPDLTYIRIEARRIGAGKVDSGDVTEAQYQHDLAELETRVSAEETRRREMTDRAQTPAPTPVDSLIAGLPALTPAPTAAELPPVPRGACLPLADLKACK